jgi:propionyl-CoA synthetase
MAPTAIRVIKKEDYEGDFIKKFDVSSVKTFCIVGERCDPDTIHWINNKLPNVILNDTWWQTETGWPIGANILNLKDFKTVFPTLPGSVTRCVPGYKVQIFDEANHEVPPDTLGKVVIKLPMPPSFMLTLWGNDQAFIEKYLAETPGYYTTGDAGMIDSNGYIHIMTRMDDVINSAGHRISTGRLEEVVNEHDSIVESAVVGYNHHIRGECPLAFCIIKGHVDTLTEEEHLKIAKDVNEKVRADVGAFARLIGVIFVSKLPKTRSGKILRGTIRKIVNKQEYKMPATIDDASSLEMIAEKREIWLATLKD